MATKEKNKAKLEESKNGRKFKIVGIVDTNEKSINEIRKEFCSQTGVEYLGRMVSTATRISYIIVKYNGKRYRENELSAVGNPTAKEYTLVFHLFSDTDIVLEPIDNYYYCVEYCDENYDSEDVEDYFFKKDEKEEAERWVKCFGGDEFAFIESVEEYLRADC